MFKALCKLRRPLHSLMTQLRSGHIALNSSLCWIGRLESPNCSQCKTKETVEHFLLTCRRFSIPRTSRRQHVGKFDLPVTLPNLLSNPTIIPFMVQYVIRTKRFPMYNQAISVLPSASDYELGLESNRELKDKDKRRASGGRRRRNQEAPGCNRNSQRTHGSSFILIHFSPLSSSRSHLPRSLSSLSLSLSHLHSIPSTLNTSTLLSPLPIHPPSHTPLRRRRPRRSPTTPYPTSGL